MILLNYVLGFYELGRGPAAERLFVYVRAVTAVGLRRARF